MTKYVVTGRSWAQVQERILRRLETPTGTGGTTDFLDGWVGSLASEYHVRLNIERKVYIRLSASKSPPIDWTIKRVSVTIPEPLHTALVWRDIKTLLGGTSGYVWGNWLASQQFENRAKIAVYTESRELSENIVKDLARKSSLSPYAFSVSQIAEEDVHARGKPRDYAPVRIYPHSLKLFHKKTIGSRAEVRQTSWLPLWVTNPPSNWQQEIDAIWV